MKKNLLLLIFFFALITKAQTPGDVAQNFGPPGFNNTLYAIATQNDGKIIVGGNFSTYQGVSESRIIRLNTDGTKDTSFNTGTGFNATVYAITLQSDGKILIGGRFTTYNGLTENYIIRLNTNGSKDTSFNNNIGFNFDVVAISIQSDGKILAGGDFTTYKGTTENRIIRLNSDGSKDTSFNSSTGFDALVQTIAVQSDGKILVGGNFITYGATTVNRITRLNNDGTRDTTFTSGTGFNNNIYVITVLSGGKILVGGQFTSYQGATENRIIRLNTNGSKDTSFITGSGFNSIVWSISTQSDGKIFIGGQFSTYQGATENRIIRLNADGSKDTTFNIGTGFNGAVVAISNPNAGKILAIGSFTSYKANNTSPYLIRLHIESTLSSDSFDVVNDMVVYPNPVKNVLHITSFTKNIAAVKIYNIQGKLVLETTHDKIDVNSLNSGLYHVKIKTNKGEETHKFIKE